MFGFDQPEDGSEERFGERARSWKIIWGQAGILAYWGWWVFHNCIAHPLIGILPLKPFFALHDWTSRKMNP